jgi:signal transduction histidine kinase
MNIRRPPQGASHLADVSPLLASSCRLPANLTKDLIMNFLKQLKRFVLGITATTLLACGPAMAAEKGTAAEAEAMVTKAVAHIKKVGAEKAYSDFTNLAEWKPKDLYIFVNDLNSGVNMAHGANAKMVGKEVRELKDPDGKFPNKVIEEVVKTKGKGWGTEIKFMNPVTKQMTPRKVYAERLGDTLVACGIFLD